MSRIFIIGAGCSKNYSQSTTTVPELKCPGDRDFFEMAKKIITKWPFDPDFHAPIQSLLEDLTEMFGSDQGDPLSVLDMPNLSLEKVMTEIAIRGVLFDKRAHMYGWEYETRPITAIRMATFVELISRTLEEALKGPTCEKHKALADQMEMGDVVLSYNYDLLMDNALREKQKLTDESYKLSFYRTYDGAKWSKPEYSDASISLLKLHGSLNWIRCTICDSMLLLRNQKIGTWSTTIPTQCPKCGEIGFLTQTMRRVLVPPLLTKDYADPVIKYLWYEAARALNNVEEIIIIGYSLPPTDFASEALLLSGLRQKRKLIPVTIVNPDLSMKNRFSEIFSFKNVTQIETLNEFLQKT